MSMSVRPLPILADNYAWLLQDDSTGELAIVDPAEDAPIDRAIQAAGGKLGMILLTHHHADHIAAAAVLSARYDATVVGARADIYRLPPLDIAVRDGDEVMFGTHHFAVLETPGHTIGHVCYHFERAGVLLCGDTLFSLGCGRLLEGTAEAMHTSLQRLAQMADETLVCCGHEYTQNNARFALSVDPDNAALQARAREVTQLRAANQPTLPALMGNEKAENPFLRVPDLAAFAALRARKDRF
jgi:hydroxyacylglutathione hydrolase